MSDKKQNEPVLSDKTYKIGYYIMSVGALINGILVLLNSWNTYFAVINNSLVEPISFIWIPISLMLVGAIMCHRACVKYASKIKNKISVCIVIILLLIFFLVGINVSFPINVTYTYDKVQTADGAEFDVFTKHYDDGHDKVYICKLLCGGLVAKKFHSFNNDKDEFSIVYNKENDNYIVTVYYSMSEETIPFEYELEKEN